MPCAPLIASPIFTAKLALARIQDAVCDKVNVGAAVMPENVWRLRGVRVSGWAPPELANVPLPLSPPVLVDSVKPLRSNVPGLLITSFELAGMMLFKLAFTVPPLIVVGPV